MSGVGDRDPACALERGIVAAFNSEQNMPVERLNSREPLPDWVKTDCGGPATVELMIGAGAAIDSVNGEGNTPLHVAVIGFGPGAIRVLLRHGAKINQRNANGDTPLKLVDYDSYYGYEAEVEVASMLKQAGAEQ